MSFSIEFSGWSRFRAERNTAEYRRWLKAVGDAGVSAFRSGMKAYPPASSPGDWPAIRTGRLRASIKSTVSASGVEISTSMPYSGFLRYGTSRMARRKMSDDAIKEGVRKAKLGRWARWVRG